MPLLSIDIEARFAQFADAMDQIARQSETMTTKLSSDFGAISRVMETIAASAAINAFRTFVQSAIDAGDAMNDLSTRTGLTAQQLLILKGAADRSGSSLEGLDGLISKLPKVLTEAAGGAGVAARSLAILGVSPKEGLRDLNGYLEKVGVALSGLENDGNKAELAIGALGKGGDRFIPVLEALAETKKRFRELGIEMSEDFKARADKFNDTLQDISDLSAHSARQVAVGLLPALQDLANAFVELKSKGGPFVEIGRSIGTVLRDMASTAATTKMEFESIVNVVTGLSEALVLLQSGQFKAAADVYAKMRENAKGVREEYLRTQEAINPTGPPKPIVEDEQKRKARNPGSDAGVAAAKAAAEAYQKLQDTIDKISVDSEKARAAARLQILDAMYRSGEVAEKDYWDERGRIADKALSDEVAVLNKQADRQTAFRDKQKLATKEYYDAEKDLQDTIGKRAALEAARSTTGQLDDLARAKAAEQYAQALRAINASIKGAEGDSFEAAIIRFGLQYEELQKRLEANGDRDGLARLNRLRSLTAAQAAYTTEQEKSAAIETTLAAQELRIRNAQEVGAISEFEAMQRISQARQSAVPELQAIAEAQKRVAAEVGNPKLIADAENFAAKVDQIAKQADLVALKFSTTFQDAFANAFTDFATGTKSAADAFKDFGKAVITEIIRIEARMVASRLFGQSGVFGSLFGGLGTGKTDTSYTDTTESQVNSMFAAKAATKAVVGGSSVVVTIPQTIYVQGGASAADMARAATAAKNAAVAEVHETVRRTRQLA